MKALDRLPVLRIAAKVVRGIGAEAREFIEMRRITVATRGLTDGLDSGAVQTWDSPVDDAKMEAIFQERIRVG